MNKNDIFNLTNDYRNSIFVKGLVKEEIIKIDFEHWGAGECKLSPQQMKSIGKIIILYIPYVTFNTLEQALVFTKFAELYNIEIIATIVGYTSYGRQERVTFTEPELFSITRGLLDQLANVRIIDPHNMESTKTYEKLWFAKYISELYGDCFVVAPDKGALQRNEYLGIKSDVVIDKKRINGEVQSTIACDYIHLRCDMEGMDYNKNAKYRFIIYDDICDGGRTFINVANLIKSEYPNSELILCVAHAIVPFGTEHLKEHFTNIVTLDTCFPKGIHDEGFVITHNFLNLIG